jgi:hypothetical protein
LIQVTSNQLDQLDSLFFLQYLVVTPLTFQNPIQISINQSINHMSQTNKQITNIKNEKEFWLIEWNEREIQRFWDV